MPLPDVPQPDIIQIDETLRLRAYDGDYRAGIPWYQDPVVCRDSEGITDPEKFPDEGYVRGMYGYLSGCGELYFIEVLEDGRYVPIGDVTLKEENPPIAIGVARWRGKGVGTRVMRAIIGRARELGFKRLHGSTVYTWNTASQRMHEALGFRVAGRSGDEVVYELILDTG